MRFLTSLNDLDAVQRNLITPLVTVVQFYILCRAQTTYEFQCEMCQVCNARFFSSAVTPPVEALGLARVGGP